MPHRLAGSLYLRQIGAKGHILATFWRDQEHKWGIKRDSKVLRFKVMQFLFNIMSSVFKPSLIALSIAFGVAIISFNDSPLSVNQKSIDLSNISCPTVLSFLCGSKGALQ